MTSSVRAEAESTSRVMSALRLQFSDMCVVCFRLTVDGGFPSILTLLWGFLIPGLLMSERGNRLLISVDISAYFFSFGDLLKLQHVNNSRYH